jgi:sensor domain CHASE-containing protein
MKKRELIQAVEKASKQTKSEAARVVDMLGGGRVIIDPSKPPSFIADPDRQDAVEEGQQS